MSVIRLASQDFTRTTPPFIEFPGDLRQCIYGGHAIVDGGLQIDGTEIGCIDERQVVEACEVFRKNLIRNIVICGVYSPVDSTFQQEKSCKDIVLAHLDSVHVVCSSDGKFQELVLESQTDKVAVGGLGLLERENAAILNASIHTYASLVYYEIRNALQKNGLQDCPLFVSTNDGSMAPIEEASQFPIRSIISGPANSMLGASHLNVLGCSTGEASSETYPDLMENKESVIILDIGGTTTDAGMQMANGYPRQASAYSAIAGVQVNFSMPDVTSTGLGGGTIVTTDESGLATKIGPESVGNCLSSKSLCFGGNVLTLTDIAVAAGEAKIGRVPVSLSPKTISSAQQLITQKLEDIIMSTKTQAKAIPVTMVGGGAIICPKAYRDSKDIVNSKFAPIANAIGAASAKLSAIVDTIYETSSARSREEEDKLIEIATKAAIEKCVNDGASIDSVRTVERQVVEMPYIAGRLRIVVKVSGHFDAGAKRRTAAVRTTRLSGIPALELRGCTEGRPIVYQFPNHQEDSLIVKNNVLSYYPKIRGKTWMLSQIDIEWLSIGCYILGCGGGGSPHLPSVAAKQLLSVGKPLSIVNAQDLSPGAILPPVGILGSPMVSIERPGGNLAADALDTLLSHKGLPDFDASLCVEIGGSNGLSPLFCGSRDCKDHPMVDGDLMGRAFPTFEMVTSYLSDSNINHLLPASLSSGTGSNLTLETAQSTAAVDAILRASCVTMGCAAGVVSRPLTADEFIEKGIPHTHSAAWRIGRAVKAAQAGCYANGTPAEAVIEACGGPCSANILFHGRVTDVSNHLIRGHSVGQLLIEGSSPSNKALKSSSDDRRRKPRQLVISFKNENLIAELVEAGCDSKEVSKKYPLPLSDQNE